MKRGITLSIALVVSVILLSLMSSDSTVNAEPPERHAWDTGIVTPGDGQILRVTVVGALDLNDLYLFRVNQRSYTQNVCNGGVCKLTVASQTVSNPITLMPGEAASMDITPMPGSAGVRAVVVSNRGNVRVTAAIIDAVTGELTILETMEDSEHGL